jgi:hypothetical protein
MATRKLQIEIRVNTNTDGWGDHATPTDARRSAKSLANMMAEYAAEQYPDAEIRTQTIYEISGRSLNLVTATFTDGQGGVQEYIERQEIEDDICDFAESIWQDAAEQALEA